MIHQDQPMGDLWAIWPIGDLFTILPALAAVNPRCKKLSRFDNDRLHNVMDEQQTPDH